MPDTTSKSPQATQARFDTEQAAAKYARSLVGTATHRREVRCIRRGLRDVKPGSRVLDLPCGTGRLLPTLIELGYRVTAADASSHMLDEAAKLLERERLGDAGVVLVAADALQTQFENDAFDAIVCNRLLHHFTEAEARRAALRELSRICTGSIITSFFCSQSWDGLVFHLRETLRSTKSSDRIPITTGAFRRDAHAAGLAVAEWIAPRRGISRQMYAVLRRRDQ